MTRAALVLIALLFCASVESRDQNVVWKFRKTHPCPSTGKVKGACPGWNVDHVIALRCGGPDTVGNMQWITVRDHKVKTRREARECRGGRFKTRANVAPHHENIFSKSC